MQRSPRIAMCALAVLIAGPVPAQEIEPTADPATLRRRLDEEIDKLRALERSLDQQQRRLNEDRQALEAQRRRLQQLMEQMTGRGPAPPASAAQSGPATQSAPGPQSAPATQSAQAGTPAAKEPVGEAPPQAERPPNYAQIFQEPGVLTPQREVRPRAIVAVPAVEQQPRRAGRVRDYPGDHDRSHRRPPGQPQHVHRRPDGQVRADGTLRARGQGAVRLFDERNSDTPARDTLRDRQLLRRARIGHRRRRTRGPLPAQRIPRRQRRVRRVPARDPAHRQGSVRRALRTDHGAADRARDRLRLLRLAGRRDRPGSVRPRGLLRRPDLPVQLLPERRQRLRDDHPRQHRLVQPRAWASR